MTRSLVLLAVNDFPPLTGGQSTLYHALARHLPPYRTLILAPWAPDCREIDDRLPVVVRRIRLPRHRGTPSRIARGLIAGAHLLVLLGRRPVRYLLCGQLLSLGIPGRVAARLWGVPYGIVVHGADLADFHAHPLWGRLARWVVRGAETVVANSRFTAALVEELLPDSARRLVVLPLGVDPPSAADPAALLELRRRHRLEEGPVLLSVSRLVRMKGHDVVLAALPRLMKRFPGLRYLVVGSGPDRALYERLASENGVAERVIFAGAVPAADLPAYFAVATLFVQLSRRTGRYDGLEGFGLTFLEAAAHGLPAIAGRSGGVSEAVRDGETGLLVKPEDPEEFAAAAERLLADPAERARMSAAARRWADDNPWDRATRLLSGFLEAA